VNSVLLDVFASWARAGCVLSSSPCCSVACGSACGELNFPAESGSSRGSASPFRYSSGSSSSCNSRRRGVPARGGRSAAGDPACGGPPDPARASPAHALEKHRCGDRRRTAVVAHRLQVYRVLGAVFLVRWASGALPGAFALPAGGGDVLVGLLALPVAFYVHSRARGSRITGYAWNVLGILDLALAWQWGSSPRRSLPGVRAR